MQEESRKAVEKNEKKGYNSQKRKRDGQKWNDCRRYGR